MISSVLMAITIIFTKIKTLVLFFITLFKRALCCFHRRRNSSSENIPLTQVDIVSNHEGCVDTSQSWEAWDKDISDPNDIRGKTVHQQIELYRKQTAASCQPQEEPEEQDFFDDMEPRITRQKKVLLNTASQGRNDSSRLSVDVNRMLAKDSELGDWEESEGWEGQTLDWVVREALIEKKKKEREKRAWEQQQKRQERSARPVLLGARLN